MSLNSVLNTAASGLQVAQTGLKTVSDNVANVNTPGYVRKIADQASVSVEGVGIGVTTTQVRTAADAYLQNASRTASSNQGQASATATVLDQAQSLFGDPNSANTLFGSINTVFSNFISLAAQPTSAGLASTVPQVQSLFDQASDVSNELAGLKAQSDSKISSDVATVNDLLAQIDTLNKTISRANTSGGDSSGAQDSQAQALDQLSTLIGLQSSPNATGGVTLRTSNGVTVVGALAGPATLGYDLTKTPAGLTVTPPNAVTTALADPESGELKGYLDLRNTQLPGLQSQLSELVSQTANQLNTVHNSYSAVPPPATLTGRNTGLDTTTAAANFTGKTTVAITDASGDAVTSVAIDFGATGLKSDNSNTGTITVGGVSTSFTAATFVSKLNTALQPSGSASFSNGALSIKSASAANGVVAADDATTPASKGGRGFSAYYGLNDLVSSTGVSNYATGLVGADPNGFTAGGQISLQVQSADGSALADKTVTLAGGGDVNALIAQLNSTTTSVGLYGSFALDATGTLAFTPNPGSGAKLSVTQDTTQRGAGGVSVSALFGLGDTARAARIGTFSVRSDIARDPTKLALATYKPTGSPPLSSGDSGGADALAQAANTAVSFGAAGSAGAQTSTLANYTATFSASVARQAATAQSRSDAADSVKTEADTRRSSVEGVNLDEELTNLQTYQTAYSASARLVTAVKDMFDTLLNMV